MGTTTPTLAHRSAVLLAALALLAVAPATTAGPERPAGTQESVTEGAREIEAEVLLERIRTDTAPLILDVRRPDEFEAGHVPGAVNISHDELEARLAEVTAAIDDEVVVYCRTGRRAGIAREILEAAGYARVRHLTGDMTGWREKGLPEER